MSKTSKASLMDEVVSARRKIRTDGYPMSIGELVSLYDDGDLVIDPLFQRYFRWDDEQKSRFIESILLNIPTPSIFVYTLEDGRWELVDGLQRVSTVLQFMGKLGSDEPWGKPLTLRATTHLPSLEGIVWDSDTQSEDSGDISRTAMSFELKRMFKRAKFDIKILGSDSEPAAKFDLFNRLNTGGSPLTSQEILNAELIRTNLDFYRFMEKLSESTCFVNTVNLSERQSREQFDKNLIIRFLALVDLEESRLSEIKSIEDFLFRRSMELADAKISVLKKKKAIFIRTFELIESIYKSEPDFPEKGADCFTKIVGRTRNAKRFSLAMFEVVSLGVAANIDAWENLSINQRQKTMKKCIDVYAADPVLPGSAKMVSSSSRIRAIVPWARENFRP